MPEIDGLTLVRQFRADERFRDVPIIVLSTKEEPAVKAEAFAVGANDYIVKLPDRLELLARVRYHSRGYWNCISSSYVALGSRLLTGSRSPRAGTHYSSHTPLHFG